MGGFRYVRVVAVGLLLGVGPGAWGCKCVPVPVSVCQAYERNAVVFLGKVQSTAPDLLGMAKAGGVKSEREFERLFNDESPAALKKLKRALRSGFPAMAPRVAEAKSVKELGELGEDLFKEGIRMRFRVDQMFKGLDTETVDIWSSFDSCSPILMPGETELIYAEADEAGRLWTSMCAGPRGRERRGREEMAYLLLRKLDPQSAGFVEGWLTTDANELKPHPPRPGGESGGGRGFDARVFTRRDLARFNR